MKFFKLRSNKIHQELNNNNNNKSEDREKKEEVTNEETIFLKSLVTQPLKASGSNSGLAFNLI